MYSLDHLSVRHANASLPHRNGRWWVLPSHVPALIEAWSMGPMMRSVGTRLMSQGCNRPSGFHCNMRTDVGLIRSKPRPPVAFILLISSSLEPKGVCLIVMPVLRVNPSATDLTRPSDHIRMLSSPEDEKASLTIHGPMPRIAPAAAPFSTVRRPTAVRRAAPFAPADLEALVVTGFSRSSLALQTIFNTLFIRVNVFTRRGTKIRS